MNDLEYMAFPKEGWVKKRRRGSRKKRRDDIPNTHGKSIMHAKESGFCYLCAMLNGDYTYKETEEHHVVFGSDQRGLSERCGLKVYLCREHHREGPFAPHNNQEIRDMLCRIAQERFEYEFPQYSWMKIFKKNYL